MKKVISAILALCLIFSLCACGKNTEEPVERDCGLYITVEADDVYTVSCGTDDGSESCENADGTAIEAGTVVHFDFAGEDAEKPAEKKISYFVCIYDKDLEIISEESFTDDFGSMAKVKLTVTEDHHIIREGEVLTCGGDIIVDFDGIYPDKYPVSIEYPIVTMQDSPEVAEKVNSRISELISDFDAQAQTNFDAYTQYIAGLDTEEAKAAAVQFDMTRRITLGRCDKSVISFRISDTVICGAETDGISLSGLSFDTQTGNEISFNELSSDASDFKNSISEDILIMTTEDERFTGEDMAFNDGYTAVIPELICDGNWYFGTDGLVIIANPGQIAPISYGSFEFTVSYDDILKFLTENYLPAQFEGEDGSVEIKKLDDFDEKDMTLIRPIDGDGGIVLCVSGDIYNLSVCEYSSGKPLTFCSELSDGAAFYVKCEPSLLTSFVTVSYNTPDGKLVRNGVALGATGDIELTAPETKIYKGNIISTYLPYSADINGDGSFELIDMSVTDMGTTLTVSSDGVDHTNTVGIVSDAQLRLRDMDGDGKTELFLEGTLSDGSHGIYVLLFDTELSLISGENALDGYVKEFRNDRLTVSRYIKLLGSYRVWATYVISDGSLISDPDTLTVFVENDKLLKLKRDLTAVDGSTLPAGSEIRLIAAKGSELVYYVDNDGNCGALNVGINEAVHWAVNGIDEVDCFENLEY